MQQVDVIWVFVAYMGGALTAGGVIWWRVGSIVDLLIKRRQMAWSQRPRL